MFARGLRRLVLLTVLLVPALFAPRLQAQVPSALKQTTPAREDASDDPLGRSAPRGTVVGFIRAAGRGDYDQAASYLNTGQQGKLARQLARQLQIILDRETSIDLGKLSRQPEGNLANPQNPNLDLVGVANTSSGKVEIWLERVQRGNNPAIWLFSQETLRLVPEIYQDLRASSELDQYLPGWLKVTFLSLPLWRFGVVLIAVVLILLLEPLVIRLLRLLLALLAERTSQAVTGEQARDFTVPLHLILFGILFAVNASYCSTLLGRNFWRNSGNVLIVAGAAWTVMRIVGIVSKLALARLQRRQSWDKIALTGLLGRLAQISVFIIGVMMVLYLGGVNLTAALTGLGIGGIAVALAAQKTLENLFSGITIISDRPVRIGDFCKIGDVSGTVVDIGLRSTRLRTQERTIVTIANGQLAVMNLENYTMRDKFWLHPTFALSHQTTAAQMQTVLRRFRALLDQHPSVESATARVQFIRIGSASQEVEISAYVFAASYDEFLRIQEVLLLQILDIVESAGTALALPTQVTRLVHDSDSVAPRPADRALPQDPATGDHLQLRP